MRKINTRRFLRSAPLSVGLSVSVLLFGAVVLLAQEISPDLYKSLQFRHIGPQGNRVVAVAGIPGDPNTLYSGAATGGVFKSIDGGVHWFFTRPTLPIYMGEEFDPPSALGFNPPYGASLSYFLGEVPAGDVEVEIADSEGRAVRKLKGTKEPGVNRLWWDLKYESLEMPRLRTSPVGRPEIGLKAEGWRPFPLGPESGGVTAPLVPPGKYTVKVRAGQVESARELVVLKDPNSQGSEEGIRAATTVILDLFDQRLSDVQEAGGGTEEQAGHASIDRSSGFQRASQGVGHPLYRSQGELKRAIFRPGIPTGAGYRRLSP